jgi:hypothetical protein
MISRNAVTITGIAFFMGTLLGNMADRGPRVVTINLSARREPDFREKGVGAGLCPEGRRDFFRLKKQGFPIRMKTHKESFRPRCSGNETMDMRDPPVEGVGFAVLQTEGGG